MMKMLSKKHFRLFYRIKWTKFVKVLGNLSEIVLSDKVCLLNSRYSNIISHLASTME
jgi:hypothetical protein